MSLTLYYYLHKQIQTQEICPQTFESATLVKIKVSKGFFPPFCIDKRKTGFLKRNSFSQCEERIIIIYRIFVRPIESIEYLFTINANKETLFLSVSVFL